MLQHIKYNTQNTNNTNHVVTVITLWIQHPFFVFFHIVIFCNGIRCQLFSCHSVLSVVFICESFSINDNFLGIHKKNDVLGSDDNYILNDLIFLQQAFHLKSQIWLLLYCDDNCLRSEGTIGSFGCQKKVNI